MFPFNKTKERHADTGVNRENRCIDCELCLEVCEEGLWPSLLLRYAKEGRYAECKQLGIAYCTDCGNCTYECPMNIPLNKYLKVSRAVSSYHGDKSGLIPILLDIQANFGYLPRETIQHVASFLNIPTGHIYSVASFYGRLRLSPPGRCHIKVCQGTACHICGSPVILSETEKALGIMEGETSSDREYTLDSVACVGCCALAPVVTVNDETYGKIDDDKLKKLLESQKAKSEKGKAKK